MQKLLLWLTLLLVSALYSQAQSPNGPNFKNELPRLIPPSPDAAALEKFGVIPVDHSTGVPSISYPFWSWARGRLFLSLGLAYHAAGHKVEDMASHVGLGWSLTGAGRISRTVRGLPDDKPVTGYLHAPVLPAATTSLNTGGYYFTSALSNNQQSLHPGEVINQYNSQYGDTIRSIVDGELDGEQDVFSYTLPGGSGRFVFDKAKTIIPLEHTNDKIEPIYQLYLNGNYTQLVGFTITDDNGIRFSFSKTEVEHTETVSSSQAVSSQVNQTVITSWLLTKMKDTLTGDEILLSYTELGSAQQYVTYETGFMEHKTTDTDNPGRLLGLPPADVYTSSYLIKRGVDPVLSAITLPDGSTVTFTYGLNRQDLLNSRALTGIQVRNMYQELVKSFELDYAYFTSGSGSYFPPYLPSGNDYNKRLRLDEIRERSTDGILIKPTRFQYNVLPLHPRDSKNIDYWGYNVHPNRNNQNRIPQVLLVQPEINMLGNKAIYLDGANRDPDSVYVKAGLLEKITYPTGGFTSFEYEINRAYTPLRYAETRLQSNPVEWFYPFGQPYTVNLPGRQVTDVEINISVLELYPRPEEDPNEPATCMSGVQEQQLVTVWINSTDNSFSTTIQETYGALMGGEFRRVVQLPIGKNYTFTVQYNLNATCAYTYPFKVVVTAAYYIAPTDKPAGGVRIKKITSEDGSGQALIKTYSYQGENGLSSGRLVSIPDFGYYRTTIDATNLSTGSTPYFIFQISRTSGPVNSLNYHHGSPLIYTRVVEQEADGSRTERYYDTAAYIAGPNSGKYPYVPGQDFPNLSGLMLREVIKDKNGELRKEEWITYNKVMTYLNTPLNRNVKTGTIATANAYPAKYYVADQFFVWTTRAEEIQRISHQYEQGNVWTSTINHSYDLNRFYLLQSTSVNSKGESRTTNYSYPHNSSGTGIAQLIQFNILRNILSKSDSKSNVLNGHLYTQQKIYALWNSESAPYPAADRSAILENGFITDVTYNAYDSKGNLLQYTGKDGVVTSIVWGYKQQYPVARIMGKSYSEVVAQSGINLSVLDQPFSEAAILTELAKIRTLSGCLVQTYTYKPQVGVSSETDPQGLSWYYTYDAFNRLAIVRNKDQHIVKMYCYKYTDQPVLCNGLTFENKAVLQSFTRNNCPTGTGSSVLYSIPPGKYTSTVSQAAADQLAQQDLLANGQAYANQQGICSGSACSLSSCSAVDKKCINGICETGVKVCTGNFRLPGQPWQHTYYYQWSDGSMSISYTGDGLCNLLIE